MDLRLVWCLVPALVTRTQDTSSLLSVGVGAQYVKCIQSKHETGGGKLILKMITDSTTWNYEGSFNQNVDIHFEPWIR